MNKRIFGALTVIISISAIMLIAFLYASNIIILHPIIFILLWAFSFIVAMLGARYMLDDASVSGDEQ